MATQAAQIQVRRDTAANWTSENPTLASGEIGFETDTNKLKIGDGSTAWNAPLAYFGGGGTPGGANTNVQYNSSGTFSGDSNFVWDATNQILTLAGTAANPSEGYSTIRGKSDGSESYGMSIIGGNGESDGVSGGGLYIAGGYGNGVAAGGAVYIGGGGGDSGGGVGSFTGGDCLDSGDGGAFTVSAGKGGPTSGNGGNTILEGGAAQGGDGNGGNISLRPGTKNGSGTQGIIKFINPDASGGESIHNIANLTATRTHTLPNKNGTFALVPSVTNIDDTDSPYTALSTDDTIICDATSGAITVALPAATGSGKVYNIKKIDSSANAVTVDGDSAETIDGAANYVLTVQYESVTLQDCAAGIWYIL